MAKEVVYTSKLPRQLMERLDKVSGKLKVTKKSLIEKAISKLLEDLERAEYVKSFKRIAKDKEMKELAEMGLEDYLKHLKPA
ncbi:MAG: ribbon-helix-helix domain-containing protein [Chitinophagales bacterium]|nr:ribbon-helix-helix domain-containing protein [Chitinophagales bacterium]